MPNENGFSYHYSASQQAADDALLKRYHLRPDFPLTEDVRMAPEKDRKAAVLQSIGLGVLSLLVFGSGLSLVLTRPVLLGMIFGVILGAAGIAGMAAMPAIYGRLAENKRKQTEQRLHESARLQ